MEPSACSRFEHDAATSPVGHDDGGDANGDGAHGYEEALSERPAAGAQPSGDRSALVNEGRSVKHRCASPAETCCFTILPWSHD